jgi:hypothetical protein
VGDLDVLYFLPGNRAVLVRDHLFCRLVIDCQGAGSTTIEDDREGSRPLVTCYEIQ